MYSVMDLFYGNTVEDQLKALKKDIKALALSKYGYNYGRSRLYVAYGQQENIGDCVLVVGPPLVKGSKPFEDPQYTFVKELLEKYSISKFFLTPHFIIPVDKVTKADIKEYSRLIDNIVEIVRPQLIVVLGEPSTFSFFRRKFILRDHHGKIIGTKDGIPIVLTYAPDYYKEKSEYEDPSFKKFLLDHDWKLIQSMYKEKVKDGN